MSRRHRPPKHTVRGGDAGAGVDVGVAKMYGLDDLDDLDGQAFVRWVSWGVEQSKAKAVGRAWALVQAEGEEAPDSSNGIYDIRMPFRKDLHFVGGRDLGADDEGVQSHWP